jgi:hypothetical protein
MPRRPTATAQARALRALADELEAGTRELSPAMAKALDHELGRDDDGDYEELTQAEWEKVWAKEIERRLVSHRAGRSRRRDVGVFLQELRARR